MSVEKEQINLDEFKKEIFEHIAPMGIFKVREKFIDVVDELKEARKELIILRGKDEYLGG